ncbi:hypothetical protein [Demequina sp.]|uniref:hypothetical protein n=1 Tax=Demequina sp. TaxID=2050685 RepID=UPI0025FCF08A|nr:hypothetical protein [Demequina sp.]
MSTSDITPCSLYFVGHLPHPIQLRLALANDDPDPLDVLAVTDTGLVVADGAEVRIWRVHAIGRRIVRDKLAAGITQLLEHGHHCAFIDGRPLSYVEEPAEWTDCRTSEQGPAYIDHIVVIRTDNPPPEA